MQKELANNGWKTQYDTKYCTWLVVQLVRYSDNYVKKFFKKQNKLTTKVFNCIFCKFFMY